MNEERKAKLEADLVSTREKFFKWEKFFEANPIDDIPAYLLANVVCGCSLQEFRKQFPHFDLARLNVFRSMEVIPEVDELSPYEVVKQATKAKRNPR